MAHPQANPRAMRQPKREPSRSAENQGQRDHELGDTRQSAGVERLGLAFTIFAHHEFFESEEVTVRISSTKPATMPRINPAKYSHVVCNQ